MAINTLQMNLSALQRQDKAIMAIVETSPHVTLYSFDASLKQWSRTETEGSLFICERSSEPRSCMIILNKKDPRNHKENVSKSLEVQVQDKFLLYKAQNGAVFGLWFYDDKECNRVAACLKKMIETLELKKTPTKRMSRGAGENASPSPLKNSSKHAAQKNGQSSSIIALLSQAQQRYEEDRKRQLSPTSQSSPPQDATNASKCVYSGANANQQAPVIQISNGNGKAIKILQNPNKLAEEKLDSVVPTSVSPSYNSGFVPFSPLSNRICPVQQPVAIMNGSVEVSSNFDSSFTPIKPTLSPSPSCSNLSLTFASNLLTPELLTMSLAEQDNLLNFQAPQQNTDALLSPEALLGTQSPVSSTSLPSICHVGAAYSAPDVIQSESSGAMSPSVGTAGVDSSSSPIDNLLTRDQLRDALISLIQTDDELVSKLHECYVRRCVYSSAE